MAETEFILQEDEAMKTYLKGITVNDSSAPVGGRSVDVWYRMPEDDVRQRTYPYITIDLIDISESTEMGRNNNGPLKLSQLPYTPPGAPAQVAGKTRTVERPLAVNLDYQISAVSRSARHDRALRAAMFRRFPGRWGALYVPGDNTARTMQLLGSASDHNVDEHQKRSFRQISTVRVYSELWPLQIRQITNLTSLNFSVVYSGNPALTAIGIRPYA